MKIRASTRTRRPRLLALSLGAAAVLLSAALAESVCGYLLAHHPNDPLRAALLRRRLPGPRPPERDNREVLGLEATGLGVFPAPPPPVPDKPLEPDPAPGRGTERFEALVKQRGPLSGPVGPGPLRLLLRSCRSVREVDGRLLWDATYEIDHFHRRATPGEDRKKGADRFLILLGDSHIFGAGLRQDQTLAASLGKLLPRVRVYNYGILGLFPGQLLERIRLIRGAPEITEKRGTAVYFYSDFHIQRSMGALSLLGKEWARSNPYYFEDAHGRIAARGSWARERPFRSLLARLAVRSDVARYLGVDWSSRPTDRDYRFQTKLLEQVQDEARRLGADRFVVVCYPAPGSDCRPLIPYLEKAGLRYIDLSHWQMSRLTKGPAWIPQDGHATAETNQVLARALAGLLPDAGR